MGSICFWSYIFTEHGDIPQTVPKNQGDHKDTEYKTVNFKSLFKTQSKQRENKEIIWSLITIQK